jgi:hypothetical protein
MRLFLFGSGHNFYGGPGESAHKQFIKIPGQRAQRRVSEFAQQTALQYYNKLVSGYAAQECLTISIITNNQLGGPTQDLPKFQIPSLTPKSVQTCSIHSPDSDSKVSFKKNDLFMTNWCPLVAPPEVTSD